MLELPVAEALAEDGPEALRERLLTPDVALVTLPSVALDEVAAGRFRQGQQVPLSGPGGDGLARVYGPGGEVDFIGVGEFAGDGRLAPKRVFGST